MPTDFVIDSLLRYAENDEPGGFTINEAATDLRLPQTPIIRALKLLVQQGRMIEAPFRAKGGGPIYMRGPVA